MNDKLWSTQRKVFELNTLEHTPALNCGNMIDDILKYYPHVHRNEQNLQVMDFLRFYPK